MHFKDLNVKLILEELQKIYNPENNGYEAFKHNEVKYLLLSHLQASRDISLYSREFFVDSILGKIHTYGFTEKGFKEASENTRKEYFNSKEIEYTLLTSTSIDYLPFKKIKINDSEIKVNGEKFPAKFKSSRKSLYFKHYRKEEQNDFLKISVQVKSKNYLDAFEKATYDLNIFRAILCLQLNPATEIPLSSSSKRAINKVKNGFFQTLHFTESGETINNHTYWFETDSPDKVTILSKEKAFHLRRETLLWLNKIKKCSQTHQRKLGEVFNLFTEAFDENDKNTCFLKAWTTLENLLDTHDNNLIIQRCLSIYVQHQRDYQREILRGLRIQRNLFVHENVNRLNAIVNCYHIQRFIRDLLIYNNLRHYKIIKNNTEATLLLDYRLKPRKEFNSQLKIMKAVEKFRKNE